MSHVYDNWEKLISAVDKREQYYALCRLDSLSSVSSSDYDASTSTRRFSFDISSSDTDQLNEHAPQDGNSQSFTSSANSIFNHVPKPPKMPSSSRFDKIFGAARRFVSPVRNIPENQISNLSPDINAPEIHGGPSGYSAPTEIEVKGNIPTIDAYALSFNELKEQTNNFGGRTITGKGFYGDMHFARLENGKDVTFKILNASEYDSDDEFLTEVSTVSRFKHENVVEFLGYCIENDLRILAYESTMGTLYKILHREQTGPVLDWMQRVRIAVEAARGLEYLHENGAIHKDITSSKVLLFNDFKAKIAGINLSTKDFDDYLDNPDPLYYFIRPEPPGYEYHAPEVSRVRRWTQKSDVYSFGVVLLELLTGRKPLDTMLYGQDKCLVNWAKPKLSRKYRVKQCVDPKLNGEYPPKAAAKLAQLAAQCVDSDPRLRPDMRDVVKVLQTLTLLRVPLR